MSDINLQVNTTDITSVVNVDTTTIEINPEPIALNIYSGGYATPGGNVDELQFNSNGVLGGIPNVTFASGNLSLGNIANIKINGGSANYAILTDGNGNLSFQNIANANYANFANLANNFYGNTSNIVILGGTNGYVLQTDGLGNLTWTAQTGGNAGNGTPGGANTQIQYNDSGSFGGNAGFTFNETTGNVAMPASLAVTGNINGNNINGNIYGNVTSDTINVGNITANSAVNLGNISNVIISGGSNGYFLQTNGNGNLTFAEVPPITDWNSVANIAVGDIFLGKTFNIVANAGANITVTNAFNANNWDLVNLTASIGGVTYANGKFYATTSANGQLAYSVTGSQWDISNVPLNPSLGAQLANNNLIIVQSGSNKAAYSTDNGNTWSNVTLQANRTWSRLAYGNGTTILISQESASNIKFQKSTDDGATWSNVTISGTNTYRDIAYGANAFCAVAYGSSNVRRSTDNGNTWSNVAISNPFTRSNLITSIAYGNGAFVAISQGGPNYAGPSGVFYSTDDGNSWSTANIANGSWYGITYTTDGYFIATDALSDSVISSNNFTTWNTNSTGLANIYGGGIAYSIIQSTTVITQEAGANVANIAVASVDKINVYDSSGNANTAQPAPAGTYRNLGGINGNLGAMFTRVS